MKLTVSIELSGNQRIVGYIEGNDYVDAQFTYSSEYLRTSGVQPISISLPLQEGAFSSAVTKNYFEGLLPEGFSRRAVANWVKTDENDYLSILRELGRECIGAIQIISEEGNYDYASYQELSNEKVKSLAAEGATKSTELLMETHLSLAGASGKVGLYLKDGVWYKPLGMAASTHIVKQSHVRLNNLVQNELLSIMTAKNLGLDVINSFVVNTGSGKDSDILYATERYDRVFLNGKSVDGLMIPNRLHQEDFGMALGIPSAEKYERKDSGYLAKMFNLIVTDSTNPLEDQCKLWDQIVFNYLVGNTDCHIKNYSLLYSDDLKRIRLAPAYDIVCTRAYSGPTDMSFFIGGELNIERMGRLNFVKAAKDTSLSTRLAMQHFDDLAHRFESAVEKAYEELIYMGFEDVEFIKNAMLNKSGYSSLL